jgi:hypothetical protein
MTRYWSEPWASDDRNNWNRNLRLHRDNTPDSTRNSDCRIVEPMKQHRDREWAGPSSSHSPTT